MRQEFITKCIRFFITEYDSFITKSNRDSTWFNIIVIKTANLLYQNKDLWRDIMGTVNESNNTAWKYGIDL